MIKMNVTKRFKGKAFQKYLHVDVPSFNAFKENSNLEFILVCIQMISSMYKYQYERYDDQGNIVEVIISDDKIEPFEDAWGIKLITIDDKEGTSLYYSRLVNEKNKDCDAVLINLVISTLSAIKENFDICIDALEDEDVKREVCNNKDLLISFLNKAIEDFNNAKGE